MKRMHALELTGSAVVRCPCCSRRDGLTPGGCLYCVACEDGGRVVMQHLYSEGVAQTSRKQQQKRPSHVPEIGNSADLPICELPVAAIGASPALRLIDCPECLRRAVTSTEERLGMLRELLAKVETAS